MTEEPLTTPSQAESTSSKPEGESISQILGPAQQPEQVDETVYITNEQIAEFAERFSLAFRGEIPESGARSRIIPKDMLLLYLDSFLEWEKTTSFIKGPAKLRLMSPKTRHVLGWVGMAVYVVANFAILRWKQISAFFQQKMGKQQPSQALRSPSAPETPTRHQEPQKASEVVAVVAECPSCKHSVGFADKNSILPDGSMILTCANPQCVHRWRWIPPGLKQEQQEQQAQESNESPDNANAESVENLEEASKEEEQEEHKSHGE